MNLPRALLPVALAAILPGCNDNAAPDAAKPIVLPPVVITAKRLTTEQKALMQQDIDMEKTATRTLPLDSQ